MKTLLIGILAILGGVSEMGRSTAEPRSVAGPTGCERCGSCVCRCRGFGKQTADNGLEQRFQKRRVTAVAAVRG